MNVGHERLQILPKLFKSEPMIQTVTLLSLPNNARLSGPAVTPMAFVHAIVLAYERAGS